MAEASEEGQGPRRAVKPMMMINKQHNVVVLEKHTFSQLVIQFSNFYGINVQKSPPAVLISDQMKPAHPS
jgi:hypothetical protein